MTEPGTLTVMVEIPKGSRNKYELDHETGQIMLDRMLFTSMQYPADYGFIDGTLGGDGDPLDALVFVGEPTFLCVPLRDPMWSHVEDLRDLNENLLNEIEHFFQVYKQLEGHTVSTEGFEPRAEAMKVIHQAFKRAGGRHR